MEICFTWEWDLFIPGFGGTLSRGQSAISRWSLGGSTPCRTVLIRGVAFFAIGQSCIDRYGRILPACGGISMAIRPESAFKILLQKQGWLDYRDYRECSARYRLGLARYDTWYSAGCAAHPPYTYGKTGL